MADYSLDPTAEARLTDRACSIASAALRRVAGRELLVQPLRVRLEWSDLTKKFSQRVTVFKHVTDLTLAFGAKGENVGWKIDERLAACTDETLPESAIEKLARRADFVAPGAGLDKVETVALPEKRFYQRAVFIDGSSKREVLVNPVDGTIIGTLLVTPSLAPETVKEAPEMAWDWVTAYIAKQGGDPIPQRRLKELFRLTVVAAQRDPNGVVLYQLKLWAQYTYGDVRLAPDSGEVLSWSFDRLVGATGAPQVSDGEALALARNEFRETKDIEGPRVDKNKVGGAELIVVHWGHQVGALRVEADQCNVVINTANKTVASFARKWRAVPPTLLVPAKLTGEQAQAEAERRRADLKLAPEFKSKVLGECIIEMAAQPDTPSPVSLYRVWRIGFTAPNNPEFTEVAVDSYLGTVVRVTGW